VIPVKQAVQNAVEFARDLPSVGLPGDWTNDVLLEEVEKGKSKALNVWFVTLSILGLFDPLFGSMPNRSRIYKTFTVHGETGEVLAMKIREFAGVS
jgi:hypothetical protein